MKGLTREELRKAYKDMVAIHGEPKNGVAYSENQLIARVAKNLCGFDSISITWQNGGFDIRTGAVIASSYEDDYTYIGIVVAKEWYTEEQLKALHEVCFGRMF